MADAMNTHAHAEAMILTVRLERSIVERLRVLAEAEHRTLSGEVRHMIAQYLDAADKRAA